MGTSACARGTYGTRAAAALAFAFLLLHALAAGPLLAAATPAFVTAVIDGDTVTALTEGGDEVTVRYLGMDTPELHHPSRGREELGREAAALNASLVLGRRVLLEGDAQSVDRYGRRLAWVWVPSDRGTFLANAEIVRRGYAMPFTLSPNVRHTDRIMEAFREARREGRGLWGRASGRVFSARQAWAELPALAGHFLVLELVVAEISESDIRYSLVSPDKRARFVVYKDDAARFADLRLLEGRRVKAAGKLVAGYRGAEMCLADPVQILDIGP